MAATAGYNVLETSAAVAAASTGSPTGTGGKLVIFISLVVVVIFGFRVNNLSLNKSTFNKC